MSSSSPSSSVHSAGVSTDVLWCKFVTQGVTLTIREAVVTLAREFLLVSPISEQTQLCSILLSVVFFRIFPDGLLSLLISWLRSCLVLLRETWVLLTLTSMSSWLDDRELYPDLILAISLSINGSNSFNFQSLHPFPCTKSVLVLCMVF